MAQPKKAQGAMKKKIFALAWSSHLKNKRVRKDSPSQIRANSARFRGLDLYQGWGGMSVSSVMNVVNFGLSLS
jgi:hypothetical protein